MNTKPKGGRGKIAPYETVMVRCPVPVKTEVESLIQAYRETILRGEAWGGLKQEPQEESQDKSEIQVNVTKEEAITRAQKLSKSKRPLPHYVMELLDYVYGDTKTEPEKGDLA